MRLLRDELYGVCFLHAGWEHELVSIYRIFLLHQLLDEGAGHVSWYSWIAMHQWACAQHWLGAVQSGQVGALKKLSDRYLLAPEQRFFHRGYPIA